MRGEQRADFFEQAVIVAGVHGQTVIALVGRRLDGEGEQLANANSARRTDAWVWHSGIVAAGGARLNGGF